METLSILMNDKWVEMLQIDYLTPIRTTFMSVERSTGMCRMCVKESTDGAWHIGTAALMGYYAEFDFTKRTLSLTPQVTSTKLSLETSGTPSRILGINTLTVTLLITGIVLVFLVFVFLCLAINGVFKASSASQKKSKAVVEGSYSAALTLSELEVLLSNALNKKNSSD